MVGRYFWAARMRLALAGVVIPAFGLQSQGLVLGPPHPLRISSVALREPQTQTVLVASNRQLVRLIPELHELQVLDATTGELRARIRLDAGEFGVAKPVMLAFDGRRRLLVADQMSASLAEFVITDDRPRFVSSTRLPLNAMLAVCLVNDIAIVSALRDPVSASDLLHVVSPSGEVVRSMVSPRDRAGGIANALFGVPRIACDEARGVVFSAPRNAEIVSAHRVTGERLWDQRLPGYRRIRLSPVTSGGSPSRMMIDSTYDQTDGVFVIADSLLLVQVARIGVGRERRFLENRTFVLHARTGQILQKIDSLPPIVGAGHDKVYFADIRSTATLMVRSARMIRANKRQQFAPPR